MKDVVEEALERDRTEQASGVAGDVESFGTPVLLCLGDETTHWWLEDPLQPIDPAFAAACSDDHLLAHDLSNGTTDTLERKVARADLCLFAGYHGPRNCAVLERQFDSLPTIALYAVTIGLDRSCEVPRARWRGASVFSPALLRQRT